MAYRRRLRRAVRRVGRRVARTYRRARRMVRRSAMPSEKMAQLTVYRNPFSLATAAPKIPDGRAAMSVGMRLQTVTEIVDALDWPTTLVLYPGLTAGLWVKNGATVTGPPVVTNTTNYWYNNSHGQYTLSASTKWTQNSDDAQVTNWRVVSQGMKLSLLNNTEENDGWFEAVRLTVPKDSLYYAAGISSGTLGGVTPYTDACTDTACFGVTATAFVENPTYRTGKLRDIHKTAFILKPEVNKHEFNSLENSYDTVEQSEEEKMIKDMIDQTYDIIIVRIHGRGAGNATRVLAHVVANHELIYNQASSLARFHTRCY